VVILFATLFHFPVSAQQKTCNPAKRGADIQPDNLFPVVEFQTTAGKITIELNRMKAPITVNNFLYYVVSGTYDGTIFHRVVKDFVVQGGGYNEKLQERTKQAPIYNESGNGLKNELYSIAMARDNDPHSAVRQFYFNMGDNEGLDPGKTWGYAVFGTVMEGDEVLDLIANAKTHIDDTTQWENVPIKPIFLTKALLKDPE